MKSTDLFGNDVLIIERGKNKIKTSFNDYDGFVDKFKPKLTTDDCYTPREVMDIVVCYVNKKYSLEGKKIIRPFFPGGDYEAMEYPDDCVVIDNPPFSMVTKICRFYIERGIKFFLFSPHITAFTADMDCTHIIVSADITYENGATIKTAFVSNLFGDIKIIGDAELHNEFKNLKERNNKKLPRYTYPDNVITVSKVAYCVEKGVSLSFDKKDLKHIRSLDDQKKHGKGLFGSGFIVSDVAAAAAVSAAEEATATATIKNNIVWKLSNRELMMISELNKNK